MRLYHSAVLVLLLLFVNSCQKEETKIENLDTSSIENEQEEFLQLDWTGKEAEFFNGDRIPSIYEDLAVGNRSDEGYNYLVKAFNIVANQNDEYHFASGLVKEFGYPYWLFAHFHEEENQKALYIPIAKEGGGNVEAVLLVSSDDNDFFHFNFIPRSEINQVIFEDATEFENLPLYLFLFYNFDKILFKEVDQILVKYWFDNVENWESNGMVEERCFIEVEECFPCNNNGGGGGGGGYNPPNPLIAGGGGGGGIGECFFCFPSLDDLFDPFTGNNDQESSIILEDRNLCCVTYLYPCGDDSSVPPYFINPLGGVWWNGTWIDTGGSGGGTIYNGGNSEASAALICASNYLQFIEKFGLGELDIEVPDLQELTGNDCECGSLEELEECAWNALSELSIFRYSCESFSFYNYSSSLKISNLHIQSDWSDIINLNFKECNVELATYIPQTANYNEVNGSFSVCNIPDGVAQNAAALALNDAIEEANADYGAFYSPNFQNINCSEFTEDFIILYSNYLPIYLSNELSNYYSNLNTTVFTFLYTPHGEGEFDEAWEALSPPTEKVGDFSAFGLFNNDCTN